MRSTILLSFFLCTLAQAEDHGTVTMKTTGYVGDTSSCDSAGTGGGPNAFSGKKLQEKSYSPGMKSGVVYVATRAGKDGKNPKWYHCTLKTDDPEFAGIDFVVEDKTGGRDVVDFSYKNDHGGPSCHAANNHQKSITFKITNCPGSRGQESAKRDDSTKKSLAQNGGSAGADPQGAAGVPPAVDKQSAPKPSRVSQRTGSGQRAPASTVRRTSPRAPKRTDSFDFTRVGR